MIRSTLLAGAVALAFAAVGHAQPINGPAPMNGGGMTTDFITKASQSDEFERREGRLAETRAHSHDVRKFAAMMVKAHTKTTEDLKAAIRQSGMTPPPPPPLTDAQMQMLADLKGTHGHAFDRAYVDQQIQAHQEALGAMQAYAANGRPGPIKDAAAQTAPLVQSHLSMAQDLQGRIGG